MPADIVIVGAATAKGQDYIQALLERPGDATSTSYELHLAQTHASSVELALSKIEIIHHMFEACLGQNLDHKKLQRRFDKNMDTMRMIDAIYSQKN